MLNVSLKSCEKENLHIDLGMSTNKTLSERICRETVLLWKSYFSYTKKVMEKPDKLREREICRSFHRSLKAPYFLEAAMGAKAGPEKGAK